MGQFLLRVWVALPRPQFESERGATAIEYALLAGLIAGVIGVGATLVGTKILDTFSNVINSF